MHIPYADKLRMIEMRRNRARYRHISEIMGYPMGTVATVIHEYNKSRTRENSPSNVTETTLYRHYDVDNILLYVGISYTALLRAYHHSRSAKWWKRVSYIRVEHFNTRDEAKAAERLAVANEKPLFNLYLIPK